MIIRPGVLGDAENLSALAIQVWLYTYATEGISSTISRYVLSEFTVERFQALLSEISSIVFVADLDKNLLGYAVVNVGTTCPEPTSSKVELATLYIQEHFVSKGIGSLLRAIAFYAKHGYTKLGVTYFSLGHEKHENLVLVGRDV